MKTFAYAASTAAAHLALLASAPAHAQAADQPNSGFYIAIGAGAAATQDVDLTYREDGGAFGGTGTTDTLVTRADLKTAANFNGSIGYDFGSIRTDLQVDYARNRIKALQIRSLNGTAIPTLSATDAADFCDYEEIDGCSATGNRLAFANGPKLRQLSVLANLWYDIPVGAVVTPYVGGGVGVGGFEVEGEGKARFAYQLGAGVAFNISPTVAVTADYRHRWINGATFTDSDDPSYSLRVGKVQTNLFSAGLRFTF